MAPANGPERKRYTIKLKWPMIPNASGSETKENAQLREERDILRKAAKYFA